MPVITIITAVLTHLLAFRAKDLASEDHLLQVHEVLGHTVIMKTLAMNMDPVDVVALAAAVATVAEAAGVSPSISKTS